MTDKAPTPPNQFSWDEERERIMWYKNDLEKGGWQTVLKVPGESAYHIKKFTDDPIPVKVLVEWEISLPGEVVFEAYRNFEERKKWDTSFTSFQLVETETNEGGQIIHLPFSPLPWPFAPREWLICMASKELPDKKEWLINTRDATCSSKPERSNVVRMKNGGNFYYITPDESRPNEACKFFALTNNDIGGSIPDCCKWSKSLWGRKYPQVFEKLRKDLLRGVTSKQ